MTFKNDKKDNTRTEAAIILPPEIRRPKNIRALADEFQASEMDAKLGPVGRAAQLLDFLAQKAPYQFCAPNILYKVASGHARCAREDSEDVRKFRKRSSAIREALCRTYGRGLAIESPLGLMRATVDDDDLATTQQVREVARIRSSVNAAKRTNSMIKVSQVRDPAVRGWLKGGVAPLLKTLTEDDRIFRLMPAKPKDEEVG